MSECKRKNQGLKVKQVEQGEIKPSWLTACLANPQNSTHIV